MRAISLLRFDGVRKCYPEGSRSHVVLDRVSFVLEVGDFVGVWGPRRSGKSTLLQIASGIELPDEGRVLFDGRDLALMSRKERAKLLRRVVGFASTNGPAHPTRRVISHVALPRTADGRTTIRRAESIASQALQRVGMLECAHRRLGGLSVGERIRVELARALVREPKLLVVDEPPPLHNPHEGDSIYELLHSLGSEPGRAMLVASSDLTLVQEAGRMMSLSDGQLEEMARPAPGSEQAEQKTASIVLFPERRTHNGPAA